MQDFDAVSQPSMRLQKLPTGVEGLDDICQGVCRSDAPR